jgi:hypothetical protein
MLCPHSDRLDQHDIITSIIVGIHVKANVHLHLERHIYNQPTSTKPPTSPPPKQQPNLSKTKSPIKPNPHHHFKPTNTHIMSSDQQQQQQQPSLIGGHAQYVKGAAEVRPVPLSSLSSIHNLLTY